MNKDIIEYINKCELCKLNKYNRKPIPAIDNVTPTPDKPFEVINLDLLTLEGKYFLTIMDQFSKHAQVYFLINKTAKTICELLIKYLQTYRIPDKIITDSGGEFKNTLLQDLLKRYGINIHFICVNNPKSNAIERFHSTIIESLRMINQKERIKDQNLIQKVDLAIVAYNNTKHNTTKLTPNEILFGPDQNKYFKQQITLDQTLNEHQDNINIVNDLVKTRIINEKLSRFKENDNPLQLKKKVYIKQNPRLLGKIRKPLYKKYSLKAYDPLLGKIKISDEHGDKNIRINRIKQ